MLWHKFLMALSLKSFCMSMTLSISATVVFITLKIAAKYSVLSLLAVHHEVMVVVEGPLLPLPLLLLHLLPTSSDLSASHNTAWTISSSDISCLLGSAESMLIYSAAGRCTTTSLWVLGTWYLEETNDASRWPHPKGAGSPSSHLNAQGRLSWRLSSHRSSSAHPAT